MRRKASGTQMLLVLFGSRYFNGDNYKERGPERDLKAQICIKAGFASLDSHGSPYLNTKNQWWQFLRPFCQSQLNGCDLQFHIKNLRYCPQISA